MEAPSRAVSNNGDEERALRALVDAFGSNLSAEQIVSAFCEAGKRAEVAGQILCDMLGTSSNAYGIQNSNHGVSKVPSMPDMSQKLLQANGNPRSSKMKCPPASVGAVSSFLGKGYVRSKPLASRSREVEKPMKLNADLLPMPEIRGDSKMDATTKDDCMHKEMEDFLFQILGEGFKLDRNTIADTLGKCGYDMQKSLDKLFDHSAAVMNRRINQVEDSGRQHGDSRTFSIPKKMQQESSSNSESRWQARNHLQKEVLISLFTAPERDEELPVPVLMKCTKRSNIVTPMEDEPHNNTHENITPEANTNESVEDETYKLLRKAVLEYRETMKEYYKAAIDAFKRGDHDQANKLKEKGQFFKTKADEADEESSRMMFGNKDEEESNSFMTLDLHEFTPKEALRSLKLHILNLAGTQSFKYLKVIIECNNEEDTSKGARRRLIMKLLERESIDRIEEKGADGMTIKIPLENLDTNQLSFAKK